jgi:hypothetical protein
VCAAGLAELLHDLDLRRLELVLLVEWVPMRLQHPGDELVDLRQRLCRRVGDERLERLPLGLPFVPVQPRIAHGGEVPPAPSLKRGRRRYREYTPPP